MQAKSIASAHPPWTSEPDDQISSSLIAEIASAAADEETGNRPIGLSIDLLRSAGILTDDGATHPEKIARTLMRVGAANLSVGRLLEGHINALALINTHGTPRLKSLGRQLIEHGAFLGVWGADSASPVTWQTSDDHLTGAKNFASGLGTVSHALVTVNSGPEVRLALIDVSSTERASPSAWNMLGMKATASGKFDFGQLTIGSVDWIGKPGDYLREPHFVGGVWRIAALQVGAAVGLLDSAAAQLRSMGRMEAESQRARLMAVLMRAWAGISFVEQAALSSVSEDLDVERIVSTAISARLLTEDIGLDAIKAVEQSLGLQHFNINSRTGRMSRDLSVYLRQAARDAFLQRAAATALGRKNSIWGIFG